MGREGGNMSSVLSRFRGESSLEFYTTARKLRGRLTRWSMNEKNIPKHFRPVLAYPLLSRLDALMDNITAANSVYPTTEHELQIRRDYQNAAIGNGEQIWQQLQHIDDVMIEVKAIDLNKLADALDMLVRETGLLKAWRKANKIMAADK
jgi:hypothetical protein